MNPDKALQKLIDGNKRYLDRTAANAELNISAQRQNVTDGQSPFAVILGCSDSRVPAELVFNQGLGDLFVVRVAGNIASPTQIGSVEFACQNFGARLVVVLGHSHCGAIIATVDTLMNASSNNHKSIDNSEKISANVASLIDNITPAVTPILDNKRFNDQDELISQSITANVEYSVSSLSTQSEVLRDMASTGQIKIVGAEYSLETGAVEFY